MKRSQMVALALTGLLMATGAAYSHDHGGPDGGVPGGPGGPDLMRLSKVLRLTEAQQQKIQTIQEAERSTAKELMDGMKDAREKLHQMEVGTSFDEKSAQSLTTSIAQTEGKLMLTRIKARTGINAILTAEQRELLQSLRPDHDRRPPPPPHEPGGKE